MTNKEVTNKEATMNNIDNQERYFFSRFSVRINFYFYEDVTKLHRKKVRKTIVLQTIIEFTYNIYMYFNNVDCNIDISKDNRMLLAD